MSQVKVNNMQLDAISDHIAKANEIMNEILDYWGENFDNLYYDFVDSGFLESLYKDAESQYYHLANAGYVVSYTLSGAAAGGSIGGLLGIVIAPISATLGAVIGGVIGFFCGIKHCITNPNSVKWKYDSKNVFVELLLRCKLGEEDNYAAMYNTNVKFELMLLALIKIRTKINEFQMLYANLEEAAKQANLSGKLDLAGDSTTVLGINSEVEIDGKTVEIHASDAMNAFFTYSNTVMDSMIVADYLERTYNYDINYDDIVKNANSFMYKTISSGLYSHEFIDKILPENYPNAASTYGDAAKNAVTGATGVDLEHIQSALNDTVAGSVALFGGLLGASFIGNVAKPKGGGSSGGSGGSGGGGYGGGSSGGGGSVPVVPVTPVDPDPEPEPIPEPEPDPEPVNDIEIEPVIEDVTLPEKVEFEVNPDGEPDYDELARDEWEFEQDYDELIKHREEIIKDVEEKFEVGDFDSLREELKEYGYNSAEIEAILKDKHMTIKAILEGDQNAAIAQRARELAKEAGIEDYVSKYEGRPDYANLEGDGPSESLMLFSGDENVVKAKEAMDEARDKYEQSVVAASALLTTVKENEKVMTDLKTKYIAEYGEDTKMWPEEAAKEYNESIKTYNESVKEADESVKEAEEEKKKYSEAKKVFVDAKEEFYKKSKEEYDNITMTSGTDGGDTNSSENGNQNANPDGNNANEMGFSINADEGTISFATTLSNEMPDSTVAPIGVDDDFVPADTIGVTYLD